MQLRMSVDNAIYPGDRQITFSVVTDMLSCNSDQACCSMRRGREPKDDSKTAMWISV